MLITNILERIVAYKKLEVEERRKIQTETQLQSKSGFGRPVYSMKKFLKDPAKTGIITEFKKRSPSKGVINESAAVEHVTEGYTREGASVISVLTDNPSFGGSTNDLERARFNQIPILRKDFIVDPYQVFETRAMGADVILLIAACLKPGETKALARLAHENGLEVLLEIHEEAELEHVCEDVDVVGINNRDLKTFTVDIDRSIRLAQYLPIDKLRVAESGIRDVETLLTLKASGFDGFLIGEQFMKEPDPAIAFAAFAHQLKSKQT